MSLYEVHLESFWTDSLPRDSTVNTLHFRDTSDSDASDVFGFALGDVAIDWDQTALNMATAWNNATEVTGAPAHPLRTGKGNKVKIYRPHFDTGTGKIVYGDPIGHGSVPASNTMLSGGSGNRDVGVCLSYYGTSNVKRQRGRMYCGPIRSEYAGMLRVPSSVITAISDLHTVIGAFQAHRDAPLTNADLDWVVFSKTGRTSYKVTNGWVDDEWDTQRRRGLHSTTRSPFTSGG